MGECKEAGRDRAKGQEGSTNIEAGRGRVNCQEDEDKSETKVKSKG